MADHAHGRGSTQQRDGSRRRATDTAPQREVSARAQKQKAPALPVQNGCSWIATFRDATNAAALQRGRKRLMRDVRFDVLEETLALALGFRLHRATLCAR